ncbi:MAG TPA: hypothetical protein VEW03_00845 [Longimicrobiaceae bacterium]|nr:hypothetical protein [Longimicrobiaceae bacterium]
MRSLIQALRPLAAFAAAALAACGPAGPAPAAGPSPTTGDQALFGAAIYSAAVYRAQDVLPLKPAVPDADGRVRVSTYTNWSGYQPGTPLTLTG